jgi:penicillin-binding protein 1A
MTLGGLREGVTPLDMAHAYQTFATDGKFVTGTLGASRAPVGIREIGRIKADGDVDRLARNKKRTKRVLSESVAQQAKSILSTVVTSGTAARARLPEFAAGKTGSTEGYGDAWFVGFTKRMTVAVWVGYADEFKPMETEYRGQPVAGGTFPAEIWRDFMMAANQILEDRVNAERAEKGLPPRDQTETAPVEPVAPAAPSTPQDVPDEAPTPNGGAARPEDAAPEPQTPAPAPEPQAPAPQPTPQPTPPSGGGGGGSGGAAAGGASPQ